MELNDVQSKMFYCVVLGIGSWILDPGRLIKQAKG